MAYQVQTDHQIIGATDLMVVIDHNLTQVVTATRVSGIWTISATGVADVTADNRSDAVDAMIAHALAALPAQTGYSTLVPHGLKEMP